MKNVLEAIGRFVLQFIPRTLPQGMTDFDAWSDRITSSYTLPTQDRDSIRFALATMIINLPPRVAYKTDRYFLLGIRGGAAKQIAGAVFTAINEAKKARPAAVTATQPGTANVIQPTALIVQQ